MATTLYFRNLLTGLDPVYNELMRLERGATATSIAGTTTASGTWISLGYWSTMPLVGFTFSESTSMNLRGNESNAQANAGLGARFYKWVRGTGIGASLLNLASAVELGTAEGAQTATGTPTSTAFDSGDALIIEVGITNVGTMGGNRTVTFYFNGPTAGASGDSYVTLTENLIFQRRAHISG